MSLLADAQRWHDAGCSIIPVRADGSKQPLVAWKMYQTTRPTIEELRGWFGGEHPGMGVITGAVSGNLELVEFEGRAMNEGDTFAQFLALLTEHDPELCGTVFGSGNYVQRSPSGGLHLIYRVSGPIDGNTKLAEVDTPQGRRPLIETRGEGGYFILAPSHGRVHPTGEPWIKVSGSPGTIVTLTPEQRDLIHALARELTQVVPPVRVDPKPQQRSAQGQETPGEDFNRRATWAEILEPHGWTFVNRVGVRQNWRHPDKDFGSSARADDYFWCWSSSAKTVPTEEAISKWRLYTMLNFGNTDQAFSDAARQLRHDGYGGERDQTSDELQVLRPGPVTDLPIVVGQVVCTPISLLTAKRQQWFWTNRIPLGELTIFAGHASVGKSQAAGWIATLASLGRMEGELFGTKVTTMYSATEDDWSRTLKPRFMASGADQDLILEVHSTVAGTDVERMVKLREDLPALEAEIIRTGTRLVIFDALLSAMDDLKDGQGVVRRQLEPLSKMAQRNNIAIIGVCHFRKAGGDPLMMVSGSAEFGQVIRSAIGFARNKNDDTVRLMSLIKTNLAPSDVLSIEYRIDNKEVQVSDGLTNVGVFVPCGETTEHVRDHLHDDRQYGGAKLGDCTEWLTMYMENRGGIEFWDSITAAGEANGHNKSTIVRARKSLGMNNRSLGFPRRTIWWLPSVTESELRSRIIQLIPPKPDTTD